MYKILFNRIIHLLYYIRLQKGKKSQLMTDSENEVEKQLSIINESRKRSTFVNHFTPNHFKTKP